MSDNKRRRFKKVKIKVFKKKEKHSRADEIVKLQAAYNQINYETIENFQDFPLSENTLKGLKENNYTIPTEIQRDSIGFSLKGEDILGAAKTGSGKTIAFLIPLLEVLYCKQWTKLDGLGALVITPTRELAYQIFETLRKIGKYHDFSAGLIIGGKDLKFERKRMDQCNIVICTPGRLLQHMDENPLFDCSNMEILILDEADRCLDMGFERTMNSIIENLPPKRQTLLFSATQTKFVRDLARLSLKDPRYVSVHKDAKYSTPSSLVQSYMVCELHKKMNFLWSFLKNHHRQKILVFMASCKQVKYCYESLCRMKPGISLIALYGTLHQQRRMAIYDSFCNKKHIALLATDIAARGLDFPEVNWVVQLDCPESATEYIHRAGRTARYQKSGESLLVLLPSELKMLSNLKEKKIPIEEIDVNDKMLLSIQGSLESMLARDLNLKATAQRAFVSYIKSVFLMKDKDVFNVSALDTDSYARSLGLAIPPRIRFLQKWQKQMRNRSETKIEQLSILNTTGIDDNEEWKEDYPVMENDVKCQKTKSTARVYDFYKAEVEDDGDFLQLKRKNHELETEDANIETTAFTENAKHKNRVVTRASIAKKMAKKKIKPNKKVVFNDDGEIVPDKKREYVSEIARQYAMADEPGINIETAQRVLKEEDKHDKELFRIRVKEKHREDKLKLKEGRKKHKCDEDVKDDFNETDSDDNIHSDLSWLPDPDQIYGNKLDEEHSLHGYSDIQVDNRYNKRAVQNNVKRKRSKSNLHPRADNNDDEDQSDNNFSLSQAEKLALELLQLK